MLFKLAIKNIKKSFKDYSIYFFTLVVAVSIFYIFNSLDAQESMLDLNESKYNIIQSLVYVLNYLSIFISIILGFLIVYSNNFLIKRRKKEFGLYLTLGMSKRKVSFILVIETLLIGLISLIIGLLCGIFLSQFLSLLTAKLFEVNMMSYRFIFSSSALIKTIIYFSIIFLLVMVFNVISISKNKLIDLLTAGRKNEKVKFRNKYITVISFILSISLIGYAYNLLFNGALVSMDNTFLKMIISGAIGTFLLFFSASGFFLKIFEHVKKVYFKGLNMFTLKQVNSKFNTTVFSTTIICLMLLLTIGILSGSISLINVYNSSITSTNITDFTIEQYQSNCVYNGTGKCTYVDSEVILKGILNKDYFKKTIKEYAYYEVYLDDNLNMLSMIDNDTKNSLIKQYGNSLDLSYGLPIIRASEYNKILKLYGRDKDIIELSDNEYLLTAGIQKAKDIFENYYQHGGTIDVNGNKLKPATKEIYDINLKNFSSESNMGTIIINDSLVHNLKLENGTIIGNYIETKDVQKTEEEFFNYVSNEGFVYDYITRLSMQETNITIKTMVIFVCLYLGITFAISSATILAIGELSASSDNKERYKILKKIGSDEKMLNKALFSQISISFLLPLIVALIHAYFGLKQLNGIIEVVGDVDLSSNILLTTLFLVFIYGGYFVATYFCSKGIIKND